MHARFSFLFASMLFAVGCSSSDDTTATPAADTGTGTDATTDTAKPDTGSTPTDTGTSPTDTGAGEDSAGIKCGDAVCGMGQVCCAAGNPDSGFMLTCTTGSCPDGGGVLKCDGPEDCATGAKICCAEVDVTGTGIMCGFTTGVAECRATCASNVPTMCPGKATVRLCKVAADCTESGYNKCCKFTSGGTSAEFCASPLLAAIADSCD